MTNMRGCAEGIRPGQEGRISGAAALFLANSEPGSGCPARRKTGTTGRRKRAIAMRLPQEIGMASFLHEQVKRRMTDGRCDDDAIPSGHPASAMERQMHDEHHMKRQAGTRNTFPAGRTDAHAHSPCGPRTPGERPCR
jgi:hypothetical protein